MNSLLIIHYSFFSEGKNGGLAQLARAPALQAGGQRFESVILHSWHDAISFFDLLYRQNEKRNLKKTMKVYLNRSGP